MRSLPSPSLLGLGIGVGKGWEVVLKYEIGGGEVAGRTRVRNWEERGIPKRHTLGTKHRNHNFSPGRFWREKSFVLPLLRVHYYPLSSRSAARPDLRGEVRAPDFPTNLGHRADFFSFLAGRYMRDSYFPIRVLI